MSAVRIDLRGALVMVLGLLASLLSRGAQSLRLLLGPPRPAGVVVGLLLLSGRHLRDAIGAVSRLGSSVVEALRLRPPRSRLDVPVTPLVPSTATAQRQGEGPEQQHRDDDDQ
jgi:hypothetical protein